METQLVVRINRFNNNNEQVIDRIIIDHDFDILGSIPYVESMGNGEYYMAIEHDDEAYIFTDLLDDAGINYSITEEY